MKGIVLAGGAGTRLRPMTAAVSKQLLPVYDKPMVYYPLTTLIRAGIRDILVIVSPEHLEAYQRLLEDGRDFGTHLSYATQDSPDGLPEAFIIGEEFLAGEPAALVLGDNLLIGPGLGGELRQASEAPGATIFATHVADPSQYGVVEFGADGQVQSIVEKPVDSASNWAIPGLYFYDERATAFSQALTPSDRGELEIVDLHARYLQEDALVVKRLPRTTTWMDMGTVDALSAASDYVRALQTRQGTIIGCPEEAGFRNGWLSAADLDRSAARSASSSYGDYLRSLSRSGAEDDW
jgi:glucose-1-phosphate thymidylyltransferase